MDLIYGIPGSSLADLNYSLDRLSHFDIPHLSAYHLTLEPGTVFYKKAAKGIIQPVSEDESLSQFSTLIRRLKQEGFVHYETIQLGKGRIFIKAQYQLLEREAIPWSRTIGPFLQYRFKAMEHCQPEAIPAGIKGRNAVL